MKRRNRYHVLKTFSECAKSAGMAITQAVHIRIIAAGNVPGQHHRTGGEIVGVRMAKTHPNPPTVGGWSKYPSPNKTGLNLILSPLQLGNKMNIYIKLAALILLMVFISGTVFGWNIRPINNMGMACAFAYCEQTHTQTETVNRTITVGGVTHTKLNGACTDVDGRNGAYVGNGYECHPFDEVSQ